MPSPRALLTALCLWLPACTVADDELSAYQARVRECGAKADDFRVDRSPDGRWILTPSRPDDAMAGEYGERQQCVTSWARTNGFDVTADHWGANP